ncbi:MAG: transglycosylase domain-containing protein, partial [Xanthomonadales bacterium]|nr:transglycosylase domain-containing protein [Xanthomonadales bacterium]
MRKVFRWLMLGAAGAFLLGVLAIGITYMVLAPDLPEVDTLRDVRLQVPLRVYTADRKLMGIFGEKRRIPYPIEDIPEHLKQAFLAGEDARFYEHPGVDYQGITRAETGKRILKPILQPLETLGTTADVDVDTTRGVYQT